MSENKNFMEIFAQCPDGHVLQGPTVFCPYCRKKPVSPTSGYTPPPLTNPDTGDDVPLVEKQVKPVPARTNLAIVADGTARAADPIAAPLITDAPGTAAQPAAPKDLGALLPPPSPSIPAKPGVEKHVFLLVIAAIVVIGIVAKLFSGPSIQEVEARRSKNVAEVMRLATACKIDEARATALDLTVDDGSPAQQRETQDAISVWAATCKRVSKTYADDDASHTPLETPPLQQGTAMLEEAEACLKGARFDCVTQNLDKVIALDRPELKLRIKALQDELVKVKQAAMGGPEATQQGGTPTPGTTPGFYPAGSPEALQQNVNSTSGATPGFYPPGSPDGPSKVPAGAVETHSLMGERKASLVESVLQLVQREDWNNADKQVRAIKLLPPIVRGDRKVARLANTAGLQALQQNDFRKAAAAFSTGVAADPSDVEVRNNLGYAELQAKELPASIQILTDVLLFVPDRSSAWANLADAYAQSGEDQLALASLRLTVRYSANRAKTSEFLSKLVQSGSVPNLKAAAAQVLTEIGSIPQSDIPDGAASSPGAIAAGKKLYESVCMACHAAGIAGAPKFGDKSAWADRLRQGAPVLHEHAIKGYQGKAGVMPPKGGSAASDDEVRAAVDYMTAAVR